MEKLKKAGLIILPTVLIIASIMIGSYKMDPILVIKSLVKIFVSSIEVDNNQAYELIKLVRGPRVLAGILVGAGLSTSGAVFQCIFKNPLSDSYTLGVSSGAGCGASIGILIGLSSVGIQLTAILFSIIAILVTFIISRGQKNSKSTLILSGLLVSSFFSSMVSFIKFIADPFDKLPQIIYWLMGSIASIDIDKIIYIMPIFLLCMFGIYLYRWKINVISLDEELAESFGIDIKREKRIILLFASILSAVVVSISGIIGWVGIVVPHFARMLVGSDFRKLLPTSISLGITYMLLTDIIARSIIPTEIPIGVITGLVGLPLFVYFIYKKKVYFDN
ncbi:iron complex transport system permease protein [Peptoniphilus asaccharolyticus DSM 20463]|uniref:Iron complex transport system permease protein n=1 Tax=Peptoniphilus asaccharolyticus DSM 20463 TaxID=573058 RepID=A0A1W1V2P8_PEPAS|nr:iron ABC transporter permease [Peptoniphilus asaccharolyticus]MBL7576163.1 iron ABC transporter permease [Peptoniphilus asaccharolyticus]SMB87657.1 iron complex transport system permease protein [Peptoniphilus asaccharolyticus DSM 20463]